MNRIQPPFTAETHNLSSLNRDPCFIVSGDAMNKRVVSKIFNYGEQEDHYANVDFILKAMNNYDNLVEALDNLVNDFKGLL